MWLCEQRAVGFRAETEINAPDLTRPAPSLSRDRINLRRVKRKGGPMTSPSNGHDTQQTDRLSILLIENDPAAAVLTKEVFKDVGLHEGLTCVRNGEEALAYLRNEENYAEHSHPDVIFLDLHLPKLSGLEVLREIKSNPVWAPTPVVVVSGSLDPSEIRRSYELHASCYIKKPSDLDEFLRFMRVCYEFWGSVVTLPNKN